MDGIEIIPAERVTGEGRHDIEDPVTKELPLTISLNHRGLVTLLCSPTDLNYLAVGFLATEGLIQQKDELKRVTVDETKGIVDVETISVKEKSDRTSARQVVTSGCGRGVSFRDPRDKIVQQKLTSQLRVSSGQVFALVKQFLRLSLVYRATGGVHSAALCDNERILIFTEDIGRHNTIDKIWGRCILDDIPIDDRLIITSGRVSSEVVLKVARMNIPILVSKSAPTSMGVKLANDLEMTLICFVRGSRMNVYSAGWRLITNEQ